jgi:hypothetical protein
MKKAAARHCQTPRTAHHLLPSRSNTTRNRALPLHRHQLPTPSQSTKAPQKNRRKKRKQRRTGLKKNAEKKRRKGFPHQTNSHHLHLHEVAVEREE